MIKQQRFHRRHVPCGMRVGTWFDHHRKTRITPRGEHNPQSLLRPRATDPSHRRSHHPYFLFSLGIAPQPPFSGSLLSKVVSLQKRSCVREEQIRILVLRGVVGIRIDNELGIRHVLTQRERLMVGTITSLFPFATSVGCLILSVPRTVHRALHATAGWLQSGPSLFGESLEDQCLSGVDADVSKSPARLLTLRSLGKKR
jgi:hypothetical protein